MDIKYGDFFELGKHKLLCGDASELPRPKERSFLETPAIAGY